MSGILTNLKEKAKNKKKRRDCIDYNDLKTQLR